MKEFSFLGELSL